MYQYSTAGELKCGVVDAFKEHFLFVSGTLWMVSVLVVVVVGGHVSLESPGRSDDV